MSGDFFRTFGPWAVVLLSMGAMLKFLVVDRLNQIMAKLNQIDDHAVRLGKIETILKLKGLLEPE